MTDHQIGELFERYHKYLITVIHNRLFDGCPPDYAYDLLDDVFTIAMEKQKDPKFNANPAGWLVKTAQNLADNFNRKYTNRLTFYDSSFNFDMNHIAGPDTMFEDLALKIAVEQKIWDKVLEELSPDDRVIFTMKYLQNKTPDEMAKELFMRKNTVMVHITRMKRRVKKLIKKYVSE